MLVTCPVYLTLRFESRSTLKFVDTVECYVLYDGTSDFRISESSSLEFRCGHANPNPDCTWKSFATKNKVTRHGGDTLHLYLPNASYT